MSVAQHTRILFVSADKFPPFRVDVSVLFGEELTKRGVQVDWLLQSDKACAQAYPTEFHGGRAWVGATDLGDGRWSRIRKHLLSIRHDLQIFRLVRDGNYDFVQVRNKVVAAVIALLACRGRRTRPIYWMSFPYAESSIYEARTGTARYPLFYLVRGIAFCFLLYRVILPRMFHVFVQSEQMKKDVMARGISASNLTPVPMGVQLSQIAYGEHDPSKGDTEIRILYLGTLNRLRQIDFVIRVFSLVKARYPEAVLELVGKGDDRKDIEALEEEARRLGVLSSVRFIGFLPMNEAWAFVRNARVCISPFFPTPILNSTSPTKLIEYMAMARPVVGNDHPDQRKVLEESGGGICVAWDEQEFARAVAELIGDAARAEAMGRMGRRYVEIHRDYPVIADELSEVYRELRARIQ